ncbi:inducible metalloproteinase inhibitor protein-like [Galleria mellonella]|uniref:Inducible metalloproteinase inhibitor protein-like n=1 Tax=Galleria mellonella TaxID=7137 RepID=A0A6J1WCI4_GALME|nr:inducible metalloproteinase inhibitor protein-like [Galleria mellonella]
MPIYSHEKITLRSFEAISTIYILKMKFLLYLGLCILLTGWAAAITCGNNEVEEDCPQTCTYDYCPKSADEQNVCRNNTSSDGGCVAGCKCRFNFRRADNGQCISTRDCPPFACTGENEHYDPCPPFCTDNCGVRNPDGTCKTIGRIGIVLECFPKCRCVSGYSRLNGVCVPNADCNSD